MKTARQFPSKNPELNHLIIHLAQEISHFSKKGGGWVIPQLSRRGTP